MNPRVKLKPTKERIAIEPLIGPQFSAGGIFIPDVARKEKTHGKAVEALVRHGIHPDLTLGDRVVVNQRVPGMTMDLGFRKLRLVKGEDVQAVFV